MSVEEIANAVRQLDAIVATEFPASCLAPLNQHSIRKSVLGGRQMTSFVLFMLFLGKVPQTASWTAEFASKESCMAAGAAWQNSLKAEGAVFYQCAAKSSM